MTNRQDSWFTGPLPGTCPSGHASHVQICSRQICAREAPKACPELCRRGARHRDMPHEIRLAMG